MSATQTSGLASARPARLLMSLLAIALAAALCGCEVDAPPRYLANQRTSELELQADALPEGQLTVESSLDQITISLSQLPALQFADGSPRDFVYQGWLATEADTGTVYVSMGRFRSAASNGDAYFPRGSTTFSYDLDGSFTVTSGGEALGGAAPFPDTLGPAVSFFLAIEPDPDPNPGVPTPIRLLILPVPMPDSAATQDLIVPADVGFEFAGRFDRLRSHISINTVTGEFNIRLSDMAFFDRSEPGMPTDPGLVYQAWFVDDDTVPPRVVSIERFNPNLAGDATVSGQIYPGDFDGDGVPEPVDFERMWVSIEPDGITSGQAVGSGLDTAAPGAGQPDTIDHVFPALIYVSVLPRVL